MDPRMNSMKGRAPLGKNCWSFPLDTGGSLVDTSWTDIEGEPHAIGLVPDKKASKVAPSHPPPTHSAEVIRWYSSGFQVWLQIRTTGKEAVINPAHWRDLTSLVCSGAWARVGFRAWACPLDWAPRLSPEPLGRRGFSWVFLGPSQGLEPLNRSWLRKLTPLFWLRFCVPQMRLQSQGGQRIFLKRNAVLQVTHLWGDKVKGERVRGPWIRK